MTPDALESLLDRLGKDVGVHCHAPKFRYTFASRAIANGVDPITLQRALGHTTVTMVSRCVHYSRIALLEASQLRRTLSELHDQPARDLSTDGALRCHSKDVELPELVCSEHAFAASRLTAGPKTRADRRLAGAPWVPYAVPMATAGRGRMAAVLLTDLVGSTELLSRLGEDAFDGLRRAHFSALRERITRSGGDEVKTTGDGLLATFSSAADAVGCAVGMQQAVDVHSRTAGVRLAIRVGLSLGDVVFEDGDVFGTPLVEAARLVAVAEGGQILATATVRAVAGARSSAVFADLGSLELKGLPEPVAACEVAWAPLPVSSVPMPSLLTDIGRIYVGRDGEVERLARLWKEASAGERRLAFITGEPGVGKTRLAGELAKQVHVDGAAVLAGRCDEDLGVPYQPFVEALRHFVDHAPELSTCLGRYGGELARLVPELAERVPGLPAPLRSDPETERYRLFDAVAAWLAAASHEQPLLLVLDDPQWAAKPTLLLLRHVVAGRHGCRSRRWAFPRGSETWSGDVSPAWAVIPTRSCGWQPWSVPSSSFPLSRRRGTSMRRGSSRPWTRRPAPGW